MKWMTQVIQKFPIPTMIIPSILSTGTFIVHLVIALSDGVIDAAEVNTLMASANGIETVILVAIMYTMKKGKKR